MVSDVVAIGLALVALTLAQRPSSPRRSFGFQRAEIIAAFVNGLALVARECAGSSGRRSAASTTRRRSSAAGCSWSRSSGSPSTRSPRRSSLRSGRESLNVEAAFRHVIADLLGSAGVLVAALVIVLTGWELVDPIVSIADRRADRRERLGHPPRLDGDPDGGDAVRDRRRRGGARDRRGPRRHERPRPPRLADHLRVRRALRACPRRAGRGLPCAPTRRRADDLRAVRDHPHDAAGRPRRRRRADRAAPRPDGELLGLRRLDVVRRRLARSTRRSRYSASGFGFGFGFTFCGPTSTIAFCAS